MDKVDTQEVGGRGERHWVGAQAEQSTLMLYWWCLALALGCVVLQGARAVIREPVALAEVVPMVLAVVKMMPVSASFPCYFFFAESHKFIVYI